MSVAILRYRLFDIDRIISRTLAYAIVTGLLVGVYAGVVLLAALIHPGRTAGYQYCASPCCQPRTAPARLRSSR
jgi:hypothetical protein